MQFTNPLALLLLLALPVVMLIGWPAKGAARPREGFSLGLRLLLITLLILALAGLQLGRTSRALAVIFLLDASDSMTEEAQNAAQAFMTQSLEKMGPDDQAGIIVFGADALVERSLSSQKDFNVITSIPKRTATDLAEAVRLGLALYPSGSARRMILLSDGLVTEGDPRSILALAAASGVQILAVPLASASGPDLLLSQVEAPPRIHQGERFDLRLTVESNLATNAVVRVTSDGKVLFQGTQPIQRGRQTLSLPLQAGEAGFTRYEVQIEAAQDSRYQNNSLAAFSQIEGPPVVLLVVPPAGEPLPLTGEARLDEGQALRQALGAAGIQVESTDPARLPSDLIELAPYAAIGLVDTPARDLNSSQMQALQSYVRDLGGGLIAIGGPTSFGVGGYFQTPLEETLPVDMQIKDEKRRPSLAMVFIIDHSGSMSDISGGVSKLELAKEAAIRSVDLLFPSDRIGVIAFDDSASWVVPMTDLADPEAVKRAIGSLRPGGGTDILAGVQAMARVLPDDPANLKHVILLTDGGADPTGIRELVARMSQENGITLTSIGVGTDAASFLPDLAKAGGGRYHFTVDPSSIPRIFTEETTLATRAYLVEETFYPTQANPSPILAGIREVPPLHGYVGTSMKSVAQPILLSERGDPILAVWQYGLGRAVAFTSDATARWGRDWLDWSGFPTFWAQAFNYVLRQGGDTALEMRVELQGENARLIVDAPTQAGEFLNSLEMQARVVAPDGSPTSIPLQQTAPGRYESQFQPGEPGAYLFSINGTPSEGVTGESSINATAGWVLSYSPEYRSLDSDPLAACLYDTNPAECRSAPGHKPDQIFVHNLPAGKAVRPVWPLLLTTAALLLPLDIAARRLILTRTDFQRALEKVKDRFRPSIPSSAAEEVVAPSVAALRQAKQRTALERQEETFPPTPQAPVAPSPIQPDATISPPETYTQQDETKSSTATASALLAAKREKRTKK